MPTTPARWLTKAANLATDLLFPAQCLACRSELSVDTELSDFCADCRQEMQSGDWPVCRRCASRVPKFPGTVDECGHCRDQKFWFDRTLAFGDYDELLRDQCLAMKTDRSERLAQSMGRLVAQTLADELRRDRPDAIVPIPMHTWRRLARGTNSPSALAAALARELKIPAYPQLLRRPRDTQPQIGLSNPARFRNIRGQIEVTASYDLAAPHVLLVDDILTTGATCSEAARVLKRAGAAKVTVLVVARTASF